MSAPDYSVQVVRVGKGRRRVGSAWVRDDGTVSIRLDEGTAVVGGFKNVLLELHPTELHRREPTNDV